MADNSGNNLAYANAGISAITSIASSVMSTELFKAKEEADTAQRLANMNNVMTSYEYSAYKLNEQFKQLDSTFADKISERGLQQMKDIATAKAMAAETGTSGGTTQSAIDQKEIDAAFDIANINAQKNNALSNVLTSQDSTLMQTRNKLTSLASGGLSVVSNPWLAGLSGGVSVLGNIMSSMPKDTLVDMLNFNTTSSMNKDINTSKPKGL